MAADDCAPRLRIRQITETRVHYGYLGVHILLRWEGWRDNHKRIYCLYSEQSLSLRLKRSRRNKSVQRSQPQPQELQVCLAGICTAILVYLSAKLASATVSMLGLVSVGLGAAAFGAGKLAAGAGKQTTRAFPDNIRGWHDANAGQPGGDPGYIAAKARQYAIEQMNTRNEASRIVHSREAAIQKFHH